MKRTVSIGLLLLVVTFGMVFLASCSKKTPPPGEEPMDIQGVERTETEAERQRRIAEEELDAKKGEHAQAEEQRREKEMAKFLDSTVYFAFDNSSLSPETREVLLQQARWLKENPGRTVIVEGHCDNRGTEEYNLALGSRRAQSVKDFLVNAGVESSRIITISYGEERPAVRGDNEAAWAKNRRAEFRLR